jgi:hypothetical protein
MGSKSADWPPRRCVRAALSPSRRLSPPCCHAAGFRNIGAPPRPPHSATDPVMITAAAASPQPRAPPFVLHFTRVTPVKQRSRPFIAYCRSRRLSDPRLAPATRLYHPQRWWAYDHHSAVGSSTIEIGRTRLAYYELKAHQRQTRGLRRRPLVRP